MKSRTCFVFRIAAFLALAAIVIDPGAARAKPATRASRRAKEAAPSPALLSQIHVFGGLPAPFALDAKSAILIDGHTGAVLYAYNEHEKMQPASLAKIMTFYLALEALHAKRIALDTQVPISKEAWRLSMDRSVSRMFLEVGQQVSVRELLYGLMVSSGNDAAVALAEYLGGSPEGFTLQMNNKAAELGLTETHFANPDGLPVEGEYTTAADMVKLGLALRNRFPDSTTYTGAKEYTFDKITQRNFNTLLFYDARVNGIKTGHVAEAGYHLVASAESGGMLLISAVMGTRSMEKRRVETDKVMDWAFRTFNTVHPDWHKAVPASIPIYQGLKDAVALAPATESYVTVERGKEGQVALSYTPKLKYLVAPVKEGDVVGDLVVMQEGKPVASIQIETKDAVAPGGFFKRVRDRVRMAL